ncbi:histidine kinase CKI1-like [Prunus yedoensis var. nudiflora]|uniref:Histidine kinase CKI1-like n=1 Tax=Prunus yedoensis var. nudiflora TaxID=2094558 RepID=A0A314XXC3_PRUYE|nr:histidine kinase CKI1-like [Prunus yedoensis var. nudiflora]
MPEMDGFEATREIRKEEEPYNLHITIIALTGHVPGKERRKRIEAGMDKHLSKTVPKGTFA